MKLSLTVATELEKKILNKDFLADQPLPSESRLCDAFGVSRTVIREALQQLKSQGIIHSITGSGHYVSRNNTDDFKRNFSLMIKLNEGNELYYEILELRELIENECVKLACQNSDDEFLKKLSGHLEKMINNQRDLSLFGKHDHAFHLEIAKVSGNKLYQSILESLYDNFLAMSRKVYEKPNALERVISEHKSILEAISKRDKQEASKLLRRHIQKSKDGI